MLQSLTARQRARAGLRIGFAAGLVLSLWVLVAGLLKGSSSLTPRGGPPIDVFALVVIYVVGASTVGAVFGALLPFLRSRVVAVAVGIVLAGLLAASVQFASSGQQIFDGAFVFSTLVYAVVIGSFGGLMVRELVLRRR